MRGVTFVELLIVFSIIFIIAAAAIPIYGNLQVSSQLNEYTTLIIQTLRTARLRSVSRVNDQNHGVYFEPSRYILYQGSSYAERDSDYDREHSLEEGMTLSNTLSDNEVNFARSTGIPDRIGTITLDHAVAGSRQIVINALGMIEEQD